MSSILDIAKKVGASVFRNVVPGGNIILDVINDILPDEYKLNASSTGTQIDDAIRYLPDTERAMVLSKKFDIDLASIREEHNTVREMLASDAIQPQSTRPYIAKHSFHVVAGVIVAAILTWSYAIFIGDTTLSTVVTNGWPFLLAIIGPLIVLLHAYFGIITKETRNKLDAYNGNPTNALGSFIANKLKK